MTTKTKLSAKGRVVLPREVREQHGWSAGTELWIEDRADHVVLRAAPEPIESTLDEIAGATGYRGARKSMEEMGGDRRRRQADVRAVRRIVVRRSNLDALRAAIKVLAEADSVAAEPSGLNASA